jgi:hypothetical protein
MPNVFLPIIHKVILGMDVGVQIEGPQDGFEEWLVDAPRIYQIPISWRDYDQKIEQYRECVRLLSGHAISLGIKHVPVQYREWPEYTGSPVDDNHYDKLGIFLNRAIYDLKPNRVEIFNEKNVPRSAVNQELAEYFGADIKDDDEQDVYDAAIEAGHKYGQMLKVACPMVEDKNVEIYAGALMRNEYMLPFLAGMVGENFSAYVTALSFHYYLFLPTPFEEIYQVIDDLHSLTSAPLAISETAVRGEKDSQQLRERQKLWMEWIMARYKNIGLRSIMGYSLFDNAWENTDMVPKGGGPKPVWYAFGGSDVTAG